jgi:FG-GAP-like repeat
MVLSGVVAVDSWRDNVTSATHLRSILSATVLLTAACGSGSGKTQCQNTCSQAGATQCSGSQVQTCVADANGCLSFSAPADCAPAKICGGGGNCVCKASTTSATAAVPATRSYSSGITTSVMAVPLPVVEPNPAHPTDFYFHYGGPRMYAVADLDGNGLDDLVVAPTYFNNHPLLPLEIWFNQGNGVFANRASTLIDGAVPTTADANNVFVADFNGDGVPDIFVVDQGLEDATPFTGATNLVLLSQPGGKYKDVSASLPDNGLAFNHVSTMADVNGDCFPDVVVTRFRTPTTPKAGTFIYMNDTHGGFTQVIDALPVEIRYLTDAERFTLSSDSQFTGTNGVGDLDGDGLPDLVTGSYNFHDGDGKRSIRFYRQDAAGRFTEKSRVEIPAALATIPYSPGSSNGLGVAGLYVADLNGDGKNDVVALWEGAASSYIEILRNEGNFRFSDVTLDWFGTYQTFYVSAGGVSFTASAYELRDVDGDGRVDLVIKSFGLGPDQLGALGPIYYNDGTGKLRAPPIQLDHVEQSPAQLKQVLGCDSCAYLTFPMRLTKAGPLDILLLDHSHLTATAPFQEKELLFKGLLRQR